MLGGKLGLPVFGSEMKQVRHYTILPIKHLIMLWFMLRLKFKNAMSQIAINIQFKENI